MKTYLIASLTAFVLSAAFTRLLLPVLKKLKAGQNILCYVKEHAKKAGTPTMGGLAFISAAFICACLFVKEPDGKFIVALSLGLAYAAVGFLDDLLKIRRKDNLGLKAYQKIIFQGAAAILAGVFCYRAGLTFCRIPFTKNSVNFRAWMIPFAAFVFVALGTAFFFGLKGKTVLSLCGKAGKQIASASIAIVASVAMVQIMVYSDANSANIPGMLTAVAEAAAHLMGGAYPLVSPLIGVLGTFFSGSCTVSSILFVSIQFDTARLLELPATAMVALQLVGGGIGSMIRISGVVAACATVNAAGKEGRLILICLIPTLILTALSLLAAWILYF